MAALSWTQTRLWDLFDLGPLFESGIQTYLDVALARSVGWFQASGGSVFLGKPGQSHFTVRARHGLQLGLPDDASICVGQGIGGVVAASGTARIVDDPNEHPDLAGQKGEHIAALASAMVVPLRDHSGRVFGVMNIARAEGEPVFRDSDLEQAEIMALNVSLAVQNAQMVDALSQKINETRRVNEKLIAVLDSVASAVLVIDPDGQVVNQNRIAADLLYWASLPPVDLVPLRTTIVGMIEQIHGQTCSFTERCHDATHNRSWILEAVPLSSGGGVLTIREVTEIEARERELARVKRLAEIGQMTAAIAHEIRNPLTGIRSAAQTVRQHPDLAEELLGLIEDEVEKLNDLCEDFLDFAKPFHVQIKQAKLGDVVRRSMALVQAEYDRRGVGLVAVEPQREQSVEIDQRRMEQVVVNLLRNALQASQPGQSVRVEWEDHKIEVKDEGKGMTEDQLSKLFSPFFTTKSDGTGLGLCNVRKIIDAHGGAIEVSSKPGEGSRFLIELSRKTL